MGKSVALHGADWEQLRHDLGYIYPPPWDPTRIHSVQCKLPAQSLSVPYNFCVQKVGIIHN